MKEVSVWGTDILLGTDVPISLPFLLPNDWLWMQWVFPNTIKKMMVYTLNICFMNSF